MEIRVPAAMRIRASAIMGPLVSMLVASMFACKSPPTPSISRDLAACSCAPCNEGATPSSAGIPIDLPKAMANNPPVPAEGEPAPSVIVVSIDAHENIAVDGAPAPDDKTLVALLRKGDPSLTRATIEADASVTHGEVIHVLDLVRSVGITKIAFAVSKTP